MKGLKYLFFVSALICSLNGIAQTISSTYSDNGIGLFNYQGLPNNMAMGEVGIATPTSWSLNYQNPAFLTFNRFSVFQVGVEMDRRRMRNNDFDAGEVAGGLRYLNYAFPIISGRWTTSFGLAPYSTSKLDKFSRNDLSDGSTEITQLVNSGGLSVFHWSNGFTITENLYLGGRASIIFGTINYAERKAIDDLSSFNSEFTDESSYSGIKYDLSLGYIHQLNDDKKLNFGLVYGIRQDLSGTRDVSLSSELSEVSSSFNEDIQYTLPSSIGIGFSYQKLNKLTLATDITLSQWSNAGRTNDALVNTTKMGFGLEWTPDFSSINSYWKRVSYRLGINIDKLPYLVADHEISELGISFGGSLPIGASSMDMAFKYGTLGTLDNGLIRENYFRIVIGATMNDRWFIKRRYD